jgi:tRNA threonylcarbamoyladenosine biosynthesis protein TsaE
MFSVVASGPEQTWRIGEALGTKLAAGDTVCLYGDLGAGKTSFSYGIAQGLQVKERYITSPTFTFVNEYEGRVPFYHIDLYRLKSTEELEGIGFEEYINADGVTVIEWAERAEGALPEERLSVYFTYLNEDSREIGFLGEGERYHKLIDVLKQELKT